MSSSLPIICIHRKGGRSIFLLFTAFILYFPSDAIAQLARNSQEVWPAVDIFYKLNDKFRLYGKFAGTKQDSTAYTDGSIGVYADYFGYPLIRKDRNHTDGLPGQYFWVRMGYQYSASPADSEDPFRESMFVTEANGKFILPGHFHGTIKNRLDWRINNGQFSTRYRPKLKFERDLHTEFLFFTLSASGEYIANIGDSELNRFRIEIGMEIKVTRFMNYEAYWNHQFANGDRIQSVDAFGMSLKLYFFRTDGR